MEYPKSNLKWLWDNTIFLTKHGSHAYGTNTPTSDQDFKGFAVPPVEFWLGYKSKFEQAEFKGDPDMVVFNVQKFFKLAADCNPSIIEVLFTDPSDWIVCKPSAQKIIDNKNIFISKKAKHTFSGYAVAQLKKINSHYRWLHNPPKKAPVREDFGLAQNPLLPKNQMDAIMAGIKNQIEHWDVDLTMLDDASRIDMQGKIAQALYEQKVTAENKTEIAARFVGVNDNIIEQIVKEKTFNNAVAEWRSYESWLATRNPKRSELEKKSGYDTKHGAHLVRLMRMCKEILTTGNVVVKRPDAEELLAIRNGAWTYPQLMEWASNSEKELEALYQESKLPNAPDHDKIEKMLISVVSETLWE